MEGEDPRADLKEIRPKQAMGRDARFNLGLGLLGAGFVALITVGVTVEKLWPDPWFIVSLVATIVGLVLLLTTWRLKPKPSQPVIILPSRREGFPNWEAGHEVRDGGVLLWMRSTDASELGIVTCHVQEPDGHVHKNYVRISSPGGTVKPGTLGVLLSDWVRRSSR